MNPQHIEKSRHNLPFKDVLHNENLLLSIQPGKVPPIVSWLVTERCNMRCLHCYPDSSPEKHNSELSENQHYEIINILARTGIKCVIISGGEPLLCAYLKNLVKKITAHKMAVSICTNGSLVTHKIAKGLKEVGLTRVSISIDGTEEGVHDSLRLFPGAYEKAITAIKIFSEIGISVFVDYTATNMNRNEIGNLSMKVKEMGAQGLKIKRFIPIGRGEQNREFLSLSLEEMRVLLDEFFPFDISFSNLHDPAAYSYYRVVRNSDIYNSRSFSQRIGCTAARAWFAIQTNGDVTVCPLLRIPVGKILNDDLNSIFSESPIVKSILNRENYKGSCGICKERNRCGGCRAHAFALSGDYLAEDPMCLIANNHCL